MELNKVSLRSFGFAGEVYPYTMFLADRERSGLQVSRF